jgi:hypothetical protein
MDHILDSLNNNSSELGSKGRDTTDRQKMDGTINKMSLRINDPKKE